MKSALFVCFTVLLCILPNAFGTEYVTDFGERDTPLVVRTPKTYDINLDQSYEDRWRPIVKDFAPAFHEFVDNLGLKIQPLLNLLDKVDYPIVEKYNKEFADEIQALAKLSSVSFTLINALNFIYDMGAQCTSIIAQDPQGNIIHARNLDFSFAPYLANMAFHGRYFKNGELLYEAIGVAGYTGLITGIKPGAYSFSINQFLLPRDIRFLEIIDLIIQDFAQYFKRKESPTYVVRRAFETIPDYDGFVDYLKKTDTISKSFYIVAGAKPGQGTVITKYRDHVQNVTTLNPAEGRWYLTQTNYQGNIPDPAHDNRHTAAIDWLDRIGREKITPSNLFADIMSVYPIFNNETLHTTVMQPAKGVFNTTIWY